MLNNTALVLHRPSERQFQHGQLSKIMSVSGVGESERVVAPRKPARFAIASSSLGV